MGYIQELYQTEPLTIEWATQAWEASFLEFFKHRIYHAETKVSTKGESDPFLTVRLLTRLSPRRMFPQVSQVPHNFPQNTAIWIRLLPLWAPYENHIF